MSMDFDYFVVNWGRAFLLLALTFNPTGWSYLAWLESRPDIPPTLVFFFSAILLLIYYWFFKQAMKQIKGIGILLLTMLFFSLSIGLAQLSFRFPFLLEMEVAWPLIALVSAFVAVAVSYRSN